MSSPTDAGAEDEHLTRAFAGRDTGLTAVPIVLGIVGHRDPSGGKAGWCDLKTRLRELFEGFIKAYPDTPLLVVSSLAEGADQIAARAAIDAGAFVRAPLPFPREAYRASTSFDDEESKAELDALLDHERVEWFVVPPPEENADRTPGDWMRIATETVDAKLRACRHESYAIAGAYTARRCHALVAIWDGSEGDPARPSGTAEHVQFRLFGRHHDRIPESLREPLGYRGERGLIIHVPIARGNPGPPPPQGEHARPRVLVPNASDCSWPHFPSEQVPLVGRVPNGERLWRHLKGAWGDARRPHKDEDDPHPGGQGACGCDACREFAIREELRQFRETCTTLDDFNHDLARREVAEQVRKRLEKDDTHRVPHLDDQERAWLARMTRVRLAAATVTGRLQAPFEWALKYLFIFIALSAISFHFYAHWPAEAEPGHEPVHRPVYLGLFVLFLFLAIDRVVRTWSKRLLERRFDSRGVAEALRVRRVWSIAGVGKSVADSYIGQLRGEMSWLRQALLHTCPPPRTWPEGFDRRPLDQKLARLKYVRTGWVDEQIKQFRKQHRLEHHRAVDVRRFGFVMTIAGWLALATLFVIGLLTGNPQVWFEDGRAAHPPDLLLLASSAAVILGGIYIAYGERRAHEELAKQYERMWIVFENGAREMDDRLKLKDAEGARKVVEALGREAILEHSQWLILRRSRPIELHSG